MIDIDKIRDTTNIHYNKAKMSILRLEKRAFFENSSAISDVVPGYNSERLEFGACEKDNFAVLFIDIRNSTNRARKLGKVKTFLSMHAFIPAMLEVVKHYKGYVIDLMGDGIMVFFGGKHSEVCKEIAIKNSGLCGRDMLKVKDEVVNSILKNDGIDYEIDCGVGIDYGDVIVTKIGVFDTYDVKVFGDCVNTAAKYSNGWNKVKVSSRIKSNWPTSKNGKMKFVGSDSDGYILEQN